MKLENNLQTETTWEILEEEFIPAQVVTTGSNYMIGNGYLGYRGTFADDRREHYVACVLSDTYDNADGTWKELVTAPNGLFTELSVDGRPLPWRDAGWDRYRRELHVGRAEWSAAAHWKAEGLQVTERRFASYDDLHLLASRVEISSARSVKLAIRSGIDGDVWSLNGDHFVSRDVSEESGDLQIVCRTGEHAYDVVVRQFSELQLADGMDVAGRLVESEEQAIYRRFEIQLEPGQSVVLQTYAAVYSTNDLRRAPNPFTQVEVPDEPVTAPYRGIHPGRSARDLRSMDGTPEELLAEIDPQRPSRSRVCAAAADSLTRAREAGWDANRSAHQERWALRWKDMDVRIEGDELAQTVLRYNIYHNIIATPAHTDHLPIGARGLSCQAYQGAAFWDQEIFNLPMFLFAAPEIARNILVYRYRTLNGARRKARELGYRGAYYAWISGDSGEEICPSFFFKDIISGRPIRNHFNDWQIHISPDVAYTIWKYVSVTHDYDYLRDYGAEIVFEVARFIASRVYFRRDTGEYHLVRVLGPDEYHENVDNNFFTNQQCRFAAGYAGEVLAWMESEAPEKLARLRERIALDGEEPELWRDIAERMYVAQPEPETGLIAQFDGFFQLEDTRPGVLKQRLLDKGEYWGWPNGVAVHTQVGKQADVTQAFALHPDTWDRETMRVNWEYYEPRTQHGSSLSPAVYAIVAAWVGHMEEAQRYFMKSCTVDLYNDNKAVSGGTFIGGIHTAACGISWQIVVMGFAGLTITEGGFGFTPHLPAGWSVVRFVLKRFGARLVVTLMRDGDRESAPLTVTAASDAASPEAITVTVGGRTERVAPGTEVAVPYLP